MNNKKEIKVVHLTKEEFETSEGKYPSRYYFLSALGTFCFILTRSETKAKAWLHEYSGGKYNLRKIGLDSDNGKTPNVKSSLNGASRRGAAKFNATQKQGYF